MSKASGSTNAMEVGFGILWKVKVDDNIDSLDINTTSKKIRAHEISANSIAEIMEDTVTVCLEHTSVTVETRVA